MLESADYDIMLDQADHGYNGSLTEKTVPAVNDKERNDEYHRHRSALHAGILLLDAAEWLHLTGKRCERTVS